MPRVRPPLWLARPSRFATLTKAQARGVLIALLLLVAAAMTATISHAPVTLQDSAPAATGGETDLILYQSIIDGVRAGGNYYMVAADALRAGGYPLRPFVTFRLPTLTIVEAALPSYLMAALLYALAFAVAMSWIGRLRRAFTRQPPVLVATMLLFAGMVVFVQRDLMNFHEVWAGQLIALSLALRKPGKWVEAVALGMIALLVRETSALYVAIMCALALRDGQRREAMAWVGIVVVFAVVVLLHAHAVSQVVKPSDPMSQGWSGLLGFGFFVRTMAISTILTLLPIWLAALLIALALFGWTVWDDPLALRAIATLAIYAVLIGMFGRADTFYWGLLVAPLVLVGLVFVPDGLRDLYARLLDRRRIIVTRSIR